MARNGKHKRRGKLWFFLIIVLGVGGAAFYGLSGAFGSNHEIDPNLLTAVERGDIARSVVATGTIQPRSKVEVKSKASGIVQRVHVDYGDWVKTGQVLVELDKEELRARVREARASLLAAEAAVEAAQASYERMEVEAEGPDLPFLESAMKRAERLHAEELVSRSVLEDAEMAYRTALNRRTTAVRNLAVARAEKARAQAETAQARAFLDRAEEDFRNATIVSPMAGLVLSRDVEVGDAVSSILVLGSQATLMMTLGDVSSVYVLGEVDEADIGLVYLGQPARIVVESFKDKQFEGGVTKISPLGVEEDNVTTFEVRVSIENPGGELRTNMSANAEIILEEKKDVLLIPEVAVVYDTERHASVEVPAPEEDGGRRKLAVSLGISNGVKTEVAEGLAEGQQIIQQ